MDEADEVAITVNAQQMQFLERVRAEAYPDASWADLAGRALEEFAAELLDSPAEQQR